MSAGEKQNQPKGLFNCNWKKNHAFFFPRKKRRVFHPFSFQRDAVSAHSVSFKSKQSHSSFQKVPLKRLPCLKCPKPNYAWCRLLTPIEQTLRGEAPPSPPKMLPGSCCLPRALGKSEVQVPGHPETWLPLCETRTGDREKLLLLSWLPFLSIQGFIYWPRVSLFNKLSTKCPLSPAIYKSPRFPSGHTFEF